MFLSEIEKLYEEIRDMRIRTNDYTEINRLLVKEKEVVGKLADRLDTICDRIN